MGMTFLNKRPFKVLLNTRTSEGRLPITLVHELLHVYTEVYKVNLSHEELHTLSVFMTTEIIPTVMKLTIQPK